MPTHNRADVIPFAIESVLYQTFRDFELLIVGDGCTDHTAEVVHRFDDPRIRWMDLPKAPLFGYANRNIAFQQARGEFVGLMAHDDILLPDHFEQLINSLEEHPELELAYSRPGWVTRDGLIMGLEYNLLNKSTRIPFLQRRHNALPATCVVHRRTCFQKYGYWNEDLPSCGDWDMWARIISGRNGINFTFLPSVTCLHFVAIWKTDINSGILEAHHWRSQYESSEDLPGILKREIPAGQSEQEIIWSEIIPDPVGWSFRLRHALIQVTDKRIETLVKQNSELFRELDRIKMDRTQLINQVNHLENEMKKKNDPMKIITKLNQEMLGEIVQLKKFLTDREQKSSSREVTILMEQVKNRQRNLDDIYRSYSWKIGRTITRVIDFLFGWLPGIK